MDAYLVDNIMNDTANRISGLAVDLDGRAAAARESKEATERLIEDFHVFLRSRVARYAAGRDGAQIEEMLGTAMLALYESVQKYDASKGHFFPFANHVVCKRLIDYSRKAQKGDGMTVPLEDEDEGHQSAQSAAITAVSIRQYETERDNAQLVDEIQQFTNELSEWGISMDVLVSQSPKHRKLREEDKTVIKTIAQDEDIVQTIQMKRYFPIKAIAGLTGLPPKKLERARSFILASLIILTGDYEYLTEYVNG